EAIPKFHESDFSWCAICEIFQSLMLEIQRVSCYFFMFDHEPVFCDVVFRFREFFVWADTSFTATAVEFSVCWGLEGTSSSKLDRIQREILFIHLRDRSVFHGSGFFNHLRYSRVTIVT